MILLNDIKSLDRSHSKSGLNALAIKLGVKKSKGYLFKYWNELNIEIVF